MIFTQRIKLYQTKLNFSLAFQNLIAAIPYALGWTVGRLWWLIRFIAASFMVGFEDGNK